MRRGKIEIKICHDKSSWKVQVPCYYTILADDIPDFEVAVHRLVDPPRTTRESVKLTSRGWAVTEPKTGLVLHKCQKGTREDAVFVTMAAMMRRFPHDELTFDINQLKELITKNLKSNAR